MIEILTKTELIQYTVLYIVWSTCFSLLLFTLRYIVDTIALVFTNGIMAVGFIAG